MADLPVMVWAHGGDRSEAAVTTIRRDPFRARGRGPLTCNRRLGAEGYLYLERHFGDGIGPAISAFSISSPCSNGFRRTSQLAETRIGSRCSANQAARSRRTRCDHDLEGLSIA